MAVFSSHTNPTTAVKTVKSKPFLLDSIHVSTVLYVRAILDLLRAFADIRSLDLGSTPPHRTSCVMPHFPTRPAPALVRVRQLQSGYEL